MTVLAEKIALQRLENLAKPSIEQETVKELAIKAGLSPSYARSGQIQNTLAYKRTTSKFASKFAKPLEKSLKVLAQRDFSKEKTATLTDLAVKFNIQRRSELDLTTSDTPSIGQIVGMQFINVTQQVTEPVKKVVQQVEQPVKNTSLEKNENAQDGLA